MDKRIEDKYEAHKAEVNARFEQLRANEEELNRIFARIYNMEGEVPIEVEDKYVSVVRIFDTAEEIPESYKGNRYVRTRRDEIVSLISMPWAACSVATRSTWTASCSPTPAPRWTTTWQKCPIPSA